MTSQPPISPSSRVLILDELKIPGRTGPTPSGRWGINRAAALDNFPRHGLQCLAGPWGNMGVGDLLRIFWGDGNQVLQETVDQEENGKELTLFIPAARIADGPHNVSYSVKRLGGVDEPSEVMEVFVKLTRPGGQDQNGDTPGHSELHMVIPQEILDGGIDQDNVAAGVPITILAYPHMAVGDVIQVSWGGKFVLSAPLTEAQVADPANNPIVVLIDEATLRAAGDSDNSGLGVAFEVYDVVDNRSEDWCAEQRVVVGVDQTRLTAPIVKEALNNVLDLDKLGDANATVQILAVDNNFEMGDIIVLRVRGTPVEGAAVDLEIEGEPLDNVPSVPELKVPNAVLKQLAKTQVVFSFRLKKADGSADLQSKGQFVRVIGEIQRLKAPIAEDAQQGAIDPELPRTRIEIPFDPSFAAGQAIKLFWLGTRPDFSTYLPDLRLRPITHGDIDAGESLFITVVGEHLAAIKGGKLELYYQLLIEDTVLATFNRVNATHAIRESIHAATLQVGEPRLELPEPAVDGVLDGVLDPDLPGTTLTVKYLQTVIDDKVTYEWVGSKAGKATDWVKLTSFTAGKEVPFPIRAELIKGNEGGTVKASYFIERAAGGTSYSNALEFSVGAALELKPPSIKEAPNNTSLDPVAAKDTLTVVVDYTGMAVGDQISVTWTGAPGTPAEGSHTSAPVDVGTVGVKEIEIPNSVVAFNLGKPVTVSYTVIRGGTPRPSATLTLAILAMPTSALTRPKILQAANDGEGPELDISNLTAGGTVRCAGWPLIAVGQPVWLHLQGKKTGGADHNLTLLQHPGNAVHQAWLNQGYYDVPVPYDYLKELADGSNLSVVFKAALDKVSDESKALAFTPRIYTVKALPAFELDPTPMILNGFNISIAGSGLDWILTGNDPTGTADTRVPTGTRPFTYRSSHPNIASVDSNGRVRSEGNGQATIYVSDQHQTKEYQVTTSNVVTYLSNPQSMTHSAYLAWVTQVGGSTLSLGELQYHREILNQKFTKTPGAGYDMYASDLIDPNSNTRMFMIASQATPTAFIGVTFGHVSYPRPSVACFRD